MLRPGVLPRPSAVALAAVSSSRQDPLRLTIAMWSWVVCKDYVLASPLRCRGKQPCMLGRVSMHAG